MENQQDKKSCCTPRTVTGCACATAKQSAPRVERACCCGSECGCGEQCVCPTGCGCSKD